MSANKLTPQEWNAKHIAEAKRVYDFLEQHGDCSCDAGGPDEPVHVCEKHEYMRTLSERIWDLGGGRYDY